MAYTTPPTFVDDTILTAAQLRALSTAIAELQSTGEQPSQVWLIRTSTATTLTTFSAWMRHKHRYLWWRLDFNTAGGGDELNVKIYPETSAPPSPQLYLDTSAGNASYDRKEDLNGLLADGEFYRIDLEVKCNAASSASWLWCEERSTNT